MTRLPSSTAGRTNVSSMLMAVVLLIIGCASGSKSRLPDLSNTSPAQIQQKVARNFSKLNSFEGRARVIIELPGEGHSGASRVLINFPDSIFVKTEAILGIDVGALFLDHRIFGAYAPRENVFYYGEAETLNLQDFLEIELETDELAEVLTGLAQLRLDGTPKLSMDDDQYLITSEHSQGQIQYWVDPGKYVVTRSELRDEKGSIVVESEFKRLKTRKGIVLPQTIKITRPQARERLTVYYTGQEINDPIDPANFRITTSPNARRVYWKDFLNAQGRRRTQKAEDESR